MTRLLELRDLSFGYDKGSPPVFERLSLDVAMGEFLIIKGPSGSGKSTLLRLICRLNTPRSGAILFRGRNTAEIPPPELRSKVTYVPQIPQMIDGTIRDNLLLSFAFAQGAQKKAPDDATLERMLDAFYLQGVTLAQSASKLSVGQKQRLSIMRAILNEPDALLLDEPTSALDAESAAMVFSIIERLNTDEGKTVLMVTHSDYQPDVPQARSCTFRNGNLECA
ncbi:ATP-binding cassette domain-containing protein [Chlorobaculum sp. 24CR]|uniref:ABC transporter ATP-binding protein n=1 Tax=Chlorobaculum sp. 24CR TaxID=2508878 RepID=UPI00100BE2E9|nr:ABC transporter ATP-binding protein [Chlorobaculum sp. 24CR]RXK84108.1 ATP-binding cassette domain-containing protein [Chlorobaculum sp. 24CR]